jgi:hypothetical protein
LLQSTLTAMRLSLHESRWFVFVRGSLILSMVPLLGCTLGASKQAAVPPPPKPAVVQPPAPEPQLSVPQTAVVLPSPQPFNPDALPPPAPDHAAAPAKADPPSAPKASSPRRSAGTRQESDTEPDPPAATPAVHEQAPIQPILGGDEQKLIERAIESRVHEAQETLNKLTRAKRHLSKRDQSLVDHVKSFLTQSDIAVKRGDFAQADALSERAVILARELQGE